MPNFALPLCLSATLAGCGSFVDQGQEKRAKYAAQTAAACQSAKANVTMVENTRAVMSAPAKNTDGRLYLKIVCDEADKAEKDAAR